MNRTEKAARLNHHGLIALGVWGACLLIAWSVNGFIGYETGAAASFTNIVKIVLVASCGIALIFSLAAFWFAKKLQRKKTGRINQQVYEVEHDYTDIPELGRGGSY